MKKKEMEKRIRRLKKSLRMVKKNNEIKVITEVDPIKYFASKEDIARAMKENRQCQCE